MSNFSKPVAHSAANPPEPNIERSTTSAVSTAQILNRIDLNSIQQDKSLSLHKLLELYIADDSCVAIIEIINLQQVYISEAASAALERCYITPAFMLDRFASQYKANVLVEITRGNLKGVQYINPKANEYSHPTEDGMEIVVSGRCADSENGKIREIHITCRHQIVMSANKPNRRQL